MSKKYPNTIVKNENGKMSVSLYDTEILKNGKSKLKLNNGGYVTKTTVTRMNQISDEYNLGVHVYIAKREMFARYNDEILEFKGDKLTIEK